MDRRDEIGFQVRILDNKIKQLVHSTAFTDGEENPTGTHGWFIGYLYENRERDVFQRDIQERFSVRRSTVTGILQLMEKKGLITRSGVEKDARLKKIELTPKAVAFHESIVDSIQKTEKRISEGLTPEEKETFIRLCEKIRNNLE